MVHVHLANYFTFVTLRLPVPVLFLFACSIDALDYHFDPHGPLFPIFLPDRRWCVQPRRRRNSPGTHWTCCPACRSSSCIKRSCKNNYICRTSFPSLHSHNPVLPFIDRAFKPSVEHFAERTHETSTRYSAVIADPFSYDLALMPCTLNTWVLGFTQSMLFVPYQDYAEALFFEGSDQTVCI